jgi:integrase
MNRSTLPASGPATVISGTLQSGINGRPALYERSGLITISQAIDAYMAAYEGRDESPAQRMAWWQSKIGHLSLIDTDEDHIFYAIEELSSKRPRYYAGKDADGNSIYKAKSKPYTAATLNRYVATMAALFTWCIKKRIAPKGWTNPCKGIEKSPEHNEVVRFLDKNERVALLDACKQSKWPKLYALTLLAQTTGARSGELKRLKWEDIDWERSEAAIHRTKNGDRKTLPLVPTVLQELEKFKAAESKLVFGSTIKPDTAYHFDWAWREALKQAKIKNFRFHDLRHTCASYLAQNGATLLEIGDVLGHRNLSVTKRYSHLATEHKSALVNRVLGDLK